MANSYLTKDFGSAGNRKTMTFSWWYKSSGVSTGGQNQCVAISGQQQSYPTHSIRIDQNDRLYIRSGIAAGSGNDITVVTTRKFRDRSSWYHFVVAIDTTQATEANRVKVYVNGVQQTVFDTAVYSTQNYDSQFNRGHEVENIGRFNNANTYDSLSTLTEGHFAHYHFVDGTALTPSTFGSTDSTTGEWKPNLSPTISSYGTHGFFLKFENASALGTDSSGNSKTWSVNGNLKQSISTPSNLFTTFNNNHSGAGQQNVISVGGTQVDHANDSYTSKITCTTLGMNKGKWYWETKLSTQGGNTYIGFVRNGGLDATKNIRESKGLGDGDDANSWSYGVATRSDNLKVIRHNNANAVSSYGPDISNGDIIQTWLDLDNGKVWWGVNGTLNTVTATANPATGANPHITFTVGDEFYIPAISMFGFQGAVQVQANFGEGRFGTSALSSAVNDTGGNGTFEYDPLGFYSICTSNIKDYG
tara:strand:- start:960 stop:2381 length:1422 start_codon:yes stop_codon:yes gene_type:complete